VRRLVQLWVRQLVQLWLEHWALWALWAPVCWVHLGVAELAPKQKAVLWVGSLLER